MIYLLPARNLNEISPFLNVQIALKIRSKKLANALLLGSNTIHIQEVNVRRKVRVRRKLNFNDEPISNYQRKGMDPAIMIESKAFGLKTIAWLLLVIGLALAISSTAIILATTGIHSFALVTQLATATHLTARIFLACAVPCLMGGTALLYNSYTSFVNSSDLEQEIACRDTLPLYKPKS